MACCGSVNKVQQEHKELIRIISNIPYFDTLDAAKLRELALRFRRVLYDKQDQVIIEAGQRLDHFCIVYKGSVIFDPVSGGAPNTQLPNYDRPSLRPTDLQKSQSKEEKSESKKEPLLIAVTPTERGSNESFAEAVVNPLLQVCILRTQLSSILLISVSIQHCGFLCGCLFASRSMFCISLFRRQLLVLAIFILTCLTPNDALFSLGRLTRTNSILFCVYIVLADTINSASSLLEFCGTLDWHTA